MGLDHNYGKEKVGPKNGTFYRFSKIIFPHHNFGMIFVSLFQLCSKIFFRNVFKNWHFFRRISGIFRRISTIFPIISLYFQHFPTNFRIFRLFSEHFRLFSTKLSKIRGKIQVSNNFCNYFCLSVSFIYFQWLFFTWNNDWM